MLKPALHALQMFLKGATGKDRQTNQKLSDQLLTLQLAYDQLQQQCDRLQHERDQIQRDHDRLKIAKNNLIQHLHQNKQDLEDLINFADTDTKFLTEENQDLQKRLQRSETENTKIQNENGALLGKIAHLENQLNLRTYSPEPTLPSFPDTSHSPAPPLPHSPTPTIDLSNITLALIGGHETTHREVSAELKQYGLKRCIHIPPHSIASHNRQQIKDKISNCDLIVTITSYVDHSVVKCVKHLKDAQMLAGECIRVSCHGKSGLVREILNYFEQPLDASTAA